MHKFLEQLKPCVDDSQLPKEGEESDDEGYVVDNYLLN